MTSRWQWLLILSSLGICTDAFSPYIPCLISRRQHAPSHQFVAAALEFSSTTAAEGSENWSNNNDSPDAPSLTSKIISTLSFRQLKRELHARGEALEGTTSILRKRLRSVVECVIQDGEDNCGPQVSQFALTNVHYNVCRFPSHKPYLCTDGQLRQIL